MRIALAQINSIVGAFDKNAQKILDYCQRAVERRCDLVVFPELSLFGYWAGDLLERESVVKEQTKVFNSLSKRIPPHLTVVFGIVSENSNKKGRKFRNSAVLLQKGRKPKVFSKELLPTYDVFDEYRHFEFGDLSKNQVRINGKSVLVTICEDIWSWGNTQTGMTYPYNPLEKVKGKKIDLVINLSASPFSIGKMNRRMAAVKNTAKYLKAATVYVNQVGAQDEVIFDGGSFAVDKAGKVLCQSALFEEDINVVDFEKKAGGHRSIKMSNTEQLRKALVLGIQDFVKKNGFQKVHLGLSGGIDSAVVACLAVDAIGSGMVSGFALPGPFSAAESLQLAEKLAKNLGINFKSLDINLAYNGVNETFSKTFGEVPFGVVQENFQARLRGLFLMGYSNHQNSLLLTTGNKSEYATGYCTLYGDMCGGLAPIADLLKGQVYDLAKLYNQQVELIPNRIIERPPTAELRENQKDQDTLPEYDTLDRIVDKLVVKKMPATTEVEKWVLNRMYSTEFKRWQAPPVLRVSDHAFGRGRRIPITNHSRR
jgi:NAD+ synthase (glutamine-hydrolysing)